MGVGGVTDPSHFFEDEFGGGASLGVGMSASYYGGRRSHSHRLSSKVKKVCHIACHKPCSNKARTSYTRIYQSATQLSSHNCRRDLISARKQPLKHKFLECTSWESRSSLGYPVGFPELPNFLDRASPMQIVFFPNKAIFLQASASH